MKNKKILEEGKEALNRTLLMMNYDMKKTLTENVEVLSEDAKEDQEIVNLLYNGAHSSPDTKESKLIDGFSKIKDANQFQRVEKLYATLGYETTLQDMLKSELGQGDGNTFKKIQSSLSKAGVTLSGIVDITGSVDDDTIKITVNTSSPTPSVTATDTTKNDIAEKKFPCIGYESKDGDTVGHYAPAKMDFVRLFFKDYILVYWENKTVKKYQRNGNAAGAEIKKGTWKCKSNNSGVDVVWANNASAQTTPKTPSITDKNVLNTLKFDFQYPGDKAYSYAFVPGTVAEATSTQNGTWYAKNNKTGKVFDISKHFPKTAEKLNTQFPNAGQKATDIETDTNIPEPQGAERPTPPSDENLAASQLPQNESLKKSLKNNLMEMKEKKENLMVESNIIRKRFEMIIENKTFNSETDGDFIVESLFTEVSYLKRQGYDSKLINEGIFGWIGSLLGGTVTEVPDVIKEYISAWLLKTAGVSADSYLGNVLVTLVGDLSFSDYDKFFSDCKFASNKVADALINGYLRKLQEENQSTSGAGGFVISAIRNSVVTYFADTKDSIIQKLEDEIINFLCPKMSKLAGIMGDKADAIKEKIVS
jgi:hypothetical protein